MKKLILKSSLTSHQKFVLSLLFLVSFFIGSIYVLSLFAGLMKDSSLNLADYISLLMFPLSLVALLNLLSKNGFIIENKKLMTAKFVFKIPWSSKKVDLNDKSDICILKYKGAQKFTFAVVANPDQAYEVYNNRIYLLNSNHSVKDLIFTTKDDLDAEKAISFINESFGLNFSKYNPPVVRRRR